MTNMLKIGLMFIFGCLCLWHCASDERIVDDLVYASIPDVPSFNFDVRPILSNNCYLCHGPDVSTREADLRLDLEEGLTARLEGGRQVVVPGNPMRSELLRRVKSHDRNVVMPPPVTKKELSSREIALLERWIEQGAKWEPYWAFIPPRVADVPQDLSRSGHSIDAFIDEQLTKRELKPAEQANPSSLVRRLSYVLCGLPPQALGVAIPETAPSEHEYEAIVDKLLGSPHFGERWARHWMDLTRYAEGKGHEFDYPVMGAWHYRDYLIRAFNDDLPYDQFVREHIAGDMVAARINPESGNNESLLATIHYRMSEGKHSPVDIKEEESDRIDNIIDVTTKTFQALTVSCAQCHDHKFDPIATAEYYALYGIFESTRQVVHARSNLEAIDASAKEIEAIRRLHRDEASELLEELVNNPQPVAIAYEQDMGKVDLPDVDVLGDFRSGENDSWDTQGQVINEFGDFDPGKAPQFREGSLSNRYSPGSLASVRSPTFVLDKDSLVIRAAGMNANIRLVIDNFQLIQNPIYGELELRLDSEEYADYLIPVSPWLGHKAYLEVHTGQYDRQKLNLREDAFFAVSYAAAFDSIRPTTRPMSEKISTPSKAYERWKQGAATPSDLIALNSVLRQENLQWHQNLSNTPILHQAVADSLLFQAVSEGDHVRSPVFIRGSHTQLADVGEPHRFLAAVDPTHYSQVGSNRLALAETLTNKENPLTARVMVNRLWHHIFGRGIVETVDNFGLQGKAPSHPELLDFLALEFMNSDWSMKRMIKLMVMSEAFKRSTKARPGAMDLDPQNVFLSHYPVRRLEGEAIRDAVLACSATLDLTMYGPSVPLHLDEFLRGRGRPPASGPIDGRGRRSLYQAIPRNFLPPMMLTYDMPAPFSTFGKRNVSNVPAQSLTLMNDPFILQETQRWAAQLLQKSDTFENRIDQVHKWAFTRLPTEEEILQANQFFAQQRMLYESANQEADIEQKIWSDYLHSLILMKEFIFLI